MGSEKVKSFNFGTGLFLLLMVVQTSFSQNLYPLDSDAIMDGYSVRFRIPSRTGGWARGTHFYDPSGVTKWGGVGLYGEGAVQDRIYIAHGISPHASLLGIHILSSGNVGIGTIDPLGKLEIKGGSGEQSQGQIHLVGNGETGPGDAYISFYEGAESNSKWSIGVKDNDNAFSISHGLTMDAAPKMVITDVSGNVGIGTTNPGIYKLAVRGKIRAEEIKVETGWADYVFKEDYDLPTLEEVEQHIKEKGHLINIPSAKEVEANGVELGEMNKLLLEKIEELTLYTLQQQKEINKYQKDMVLLNKKLEAMEQSINNLKE